jgi:hypothetical protein
MMEKAMMRRSNYEQFGRLFSGQDRAVFVTLAQRDGARRPGQRCVAVHVAGRQTKMLIFCFIIPPLFLCAP